MTESERMDRLERAVIELAQRLAVHSGRLGWNMPAVAEIERDLAAMEPETRA